MNEEMMIKIVSLGCSVGIVGSLMLHYSIEIINGLLDLIAEKYRVLRYSRYCNKAVSGFSEYAKEAGISDLTVQYVKQACAYYDRTHKKHGFIKEEEARP